MALNIPKKCDVEIEVARDGAGDNEVRYEMPLIDMSLVEGRSSEEIRGLVRAVTDCVAKELDIPGEAITVLVRDVPHDRWAIGGVTVADRS